MFAIFYNFKMLSPKESDRKSFVQAEGFKNQALKKRV